MPLDPPAAKGRAYASRLPLPKAPTTPLQVQIPYTRIQPSTLPVSRVLFPADPAAARYREHPGLSRIPRLAPMPETPTPPGRGRGRGRRVASAPGGLGGMRGEDLGGWRVDGRVKLPQRRKREVGMGGTWPVAQFAGLTVGEGEVEMEDKEEEEGGEAEAEGEGEVVGTTVAVGEGGRRRGAGFRRLVKRIRRSFSKVTLKLRE